MGIIEAIAGFFRAIGEVTGLISKRSDLNNTPEMKSRDEAKKRSEDDDKISKEVKDGDDEAIRNRISP